MESFTKINNAIIEVTTELVTIKNKLESDMNYSVNHAEIVTELENAECTLHDLGVELNEIQNNVTDLSNTVNIDEDDDDDE